MKMNFFYAAAIAFALLFGSCTNTDKVDENPLYKGLSKVTYTELTEPFASPERGFYSAYDFKTASSPLSKASVTANLLKKQSLLYLGFYLTDFMESDISAAYLETIGTSLKALREGGCKCILRFAYKSNEAESNKPWDASPEWTLRHIEQLKPLFQEYGDVIYLLQAGFVGVWGEWYYTDHFTMNPSSEADYAARKSVVDALLDAMPADRMVALRTPQFKMDMYKLSLADTLTAATAHNGSVKARLAGHNDCFLASSSDYGTFDGTTDRAFWKADTRYTIMGGETCNVSKYCECPNTLSELELYHWSYLNRGYNQKVLNVWRDNNCYDEVELRLGYRLVMTEGYFSKEALSGGKFRVVCNIRNDGFAAPMNPRDAELVLVASDGTKSVFKLGDVNPQSWYEKTVTTIDTEITLPTAAGEYKLYLNLPDPKPTLRANPLFSIRTANADTWDAEQGYNHLTDITIK